MLAVFENSCKVLGYFTGCFVTLGVPLAPFYAFVHYKFDNRAARKAAGKA